MKTIIAGSRNILDYEMLLEAISESKFNITEVFCGLARGPDTLGERWAKENNVPIRYFPAQWEIFGRSAGPRRNEEMGKLADCAIILWDRVSRGIKHMLKYCQDNNIPHYLKTI